ncbi:hypothetical protein [Massilia yuzhufengensis]|uniref:hypothetical protein n=1 Tax=Massilia yuzhufengensis TaxID=1164594 RepID=UPI000B8A14AB|nr:hypothetical protein [Massilia yuzhufengensis]
MLGHDFAAAIGHETVEHHAVEGAHFRDHLHAHAKECIEPLGAAQAGDDVGEIGEDLVLPARFVRAGVDGQPFDCRH